jgi:hypothetical protein
MSGRGNLEFDQHLIYDVEPDLLEPFGPELTRLLFPLDLIKVMSDFVQFVAFILTDLLESFPLCVMDVGLIADSLPFPFQLVDLASVSVGCLC